jgi:hypothetical protein
MKPIAGKTAGVTPLQPAVAGLMAAVVVAVVVPDWPDVT